MPLYDAANGSGWANDDGWLSDAPLYEWYGVTTNANGRVSELDLRHNNLSGSIPPELGRLDDLEALWLGDNDLRGSIPPELGRLDNLEKLALGDNGLRGAIPPELGRLDNLEELKLYGNYLSGPIPPELGRLEDLETLLLNGNSLVGAIPPELARLSGLSEIYLAGNYLTGCPPPELWDIPANDLENLNPSACASPRQIASDRAALAALYEAAGGEGWLDSDNWLSDAPLDQWYGVAADATSRVSGLDLRGNGLSGVIPPELGDSPNL